MCHQQFYLNRLRDHLEPISLKNSVTETLKINLQIKAVSKDRLQLG